MDETNVKKLFVGEILVVDDEIQEEGSDISIIIEYLEEKGFSVLKKETFPPIEALEGHKISMVICDWMFIKQDDDLNAESVIRFINSIQLKYFIPVFICTGSKKEDVENYLLNPHFMCVNYKNNEASSIFIVNKGEIKGDLIFSFLHNWLEKNPSVKLMKEWEMSIEKVKNKMFTDLYTTSEYWPCVLAKNFNEDQERNVPEAMGEFVTKNLLSRICDYSISEIAHGEDAEVDLEMVLEGERCYHYENTTVEATTAFKTGDVLQKGEELFIVIKRQCDLNREQNTNLYVLNMQELATIDQIPIAVDLDNNEVRIFSARYQLEKCKESRINKELDKAFGKTRVLHRGKILETVFQVIVPCVCGKKAVSIDLRQLGLINLEDGEITEYKRIARLLEPYTSIIVDKFASYMSSKGSMRIPEELFTEKYFVDDTM